MKRRITVRGRQFTYHVGRQYVVIRGEGGYSRVVRCSEIIGVDSPAFERGQWKGTSDGMVTPGRLAAWIAEAR